MTELTPRMTKYEYLGFEIKFQESETFFLSR